MEGPHTGWLRSARFKEHPIGWPACRLPAPGSPPGAGAALFADIAGFTPLTEALDSALGARCGVKELTRQINRVYEALMPKISPVKQFYLKVPKT